MTSRLHRRLGVCVRLTMKLYLLCVLVIYSCNADNELTEDLSFQNNDILQEIEKRLADYTQPDSYGDADSETRSILNSLIPNSKDQGQNKVSDPGSLCYFEVTESKIIRTHDSIENGATYIDSPTDIQNQTNCRSECCKRNECDLAVFKDKGDEHTCYLFKCGGACLYTNHTGFSSMLKFRKPQQHEVDLEMLATDPPSTTTTSTTTTTTTTTVPPTTTTPTPSTVTLPTQASLFEPCKRDENCGSVGMECASGFCVCAQGFRSHGGICREKCSRFQFECTNEGKPHAYPQCIAVYDTCDGISHCPDGSDELNCDSKQEADEMDDENLDELSKLIMKVLEQSQDEDVDSSYKDSKQEAGRPVSYSWDDNSYDYNHGTNAKPQGQRPVNSGNGHRTGLRPDVNNNVNNHVNNNENNHVNNHVNNNVNNNENNQLPNHVGPPRTHLHQPTHKNVIKPQPTLAPITHKEHITEPTKAPITVKPIQTDSPPKKQEAVQSATSIDVASSVAVGGGNVGKAVDKRKPAVSGSKVAHPHSSLAEVDVLLDEAESAHVVTTLSNRTAVMVLAMGLAVTALLLIFVGCRLRMVKRRLRRGRPLNSNEADYLINGMYL